ncbi:MAG: leucine-rich repeat protein [Eubacteriaceae bacterium]|nr:leucine-rich repeat protein [Eubacteriaceae bacterium]
MKKKLISVMLAILIVVSILPTQVYAESGNCGENITWTFQDGVLTLSGSGEMYDYYANYSDGRTKNPWDNIQIKAYLTEIVVGEGITGVGDYAFYSLSNVTKISLPSTLEKIGEFAFCGMKLLEEIVIPDSVTVIGKGSFRQCENLREIYIPAGVEKLYFGEMIWDNLEHMFYLCRSLEKIDIHEDNPNYMSYGGMVLDKNTGELLMVLESYTEKIKLPANVTDMDFSIFSSFHVGFDVDDDNPVYSSDDRGILYNKDKTTLLFIPDGYPYKEVYIPASVTEIAITHKDWPGNLEKFVVDEENPSYASDEQGGLYNKKMTKLIAVPRKYQNLYIVPKGVTTIGDGAFYMSFASNIILQEGVKTIGKEAFAYCLRLLNLTLPKSVTTIKDKAFYDLMVGDLYYAGSKSAYKKISFGKENTLYDTKIHYNHSCKHKNIEFYGVESLATCYDRELHMYICPDCEYIERRYVGEYLHTKPLLIEGFYPTCTEDGLSDGVACEGCKKVVIPQETIPATGHTYEEWVVDVEPTETTAGLRHSECSVCGNVHREEFGLYELGDVTGDGKVNALDATQILRYANNKSSVLTTMEDNEKYGRADVTGDKKINALDATQILRYANNKSSVLSK